MRHFKAIVLLTALSARAEDHAFRFAPPDEKILTESHEIDAQFEKKGLVLHNQRAQAYLDSIGNRLLGNDAPPERVEYRFRILRDPMINAFALPNGSIYVNTGLLAAMESETELAVVLAHEITHVTNRHAYIQNRSMRRKAVAMEMIAIAATGAGYLPVGSAFGYSISFASQFSQLVIVASVYGYRRELENEADTEAYERLMRAGYDGSRMAHALASLDERLEFEPTEPFWRTHPKLEARIAAAKKLALSGRKSAPRATTADEYVSNLAEVIRTNVVLDVDSRRTRTAVARAQRLVSWNSDPAHKALLADAYRSLGAKSAKPAAEESSPQGKSAARKQMLKLTAHEEQQLLLATDVGRVTLSENHGRAEKLYRDAIAANGMFADPHRGLGMLYQDQGRYDDAAQEYRAYLDLSPPHTVDRFRIERRLQACVSAAKNGPNKR